MDTTQPRQLQANNPTKVNFHEITLIKYRLMKNFLEMIRSVSITLG